jgi:hypothetical protein
MPAFGVAAVEMIDHKEELGADGFEAELRHQWGADIAANVDVGEFARVIALRSMHDRLVAHDRPRHTTQPGCPNLPTGP